MNRATRPARGHRPEGSVGGRSAPEEEVGWRGPDGALAAKGLRPLRFRHVARRVVEVGAREIEHRRGIVRLEPAEAKVELSRRAKRHVARAQAPVEARHLDEVKPRRPFRCRRRPSLLSPPFRLRSSASASLLPAARFPRREPQVAYAGRADVEAVNGRRGAPAASRRRHRTRADGGPGRKRGPSRCRGAARAARNRPPGAAPAADCSRPPPAAPPPSRAGACGMSRPS